MLGYVRTPFTGLSSSKTEVSTAFLLTIILTILAIRVVASISISLRANWILRVTEVRPARCYQDAFRFSWFALGVAPVLLLLAGGFIAGYPWLQMLGHLLAMLFLGILLIELFLYNFRKVPFTCSYLPGKANIHFVFWACLLVFLRLLKEGALFEGRALTHLTSGCLLIFALAAGAAGLRWIARRDQSDEILFEEEDAMILVSLKLN